ncbi:MAG: anti-sigma factor [Opitutaceae bacterium]|nr:anti-sigma factor [Opitutaceae bacterium]
MTDDFTSDALRFLLGEMDAAQHQAFSDRLARDPVAARAFKDCADSLAHFAVSTAAPQAVSEFERANNLAGVLARAKPQNVVPARRRMVPLPWAWPVAAAFLLVLNLLQFLGGRGQGFHFSRSAGTGETTPIAPGSTTAGTRDRNSAPAGGASSNPSPAATDSGPTSSARLAAEFARLEELRREYDTLQQARDGLDKQYNAALQQLARRALTEQGIGRLAAMELVDANSYARGDRKGLMNLARDLLTEPGIVAVDPGKNGQPGLGTAETPSLVPGSPASPSAIESPYAWSVFDEKDNRGYLNLYNLPQVPATDTLQVWVKPAGSVEFQPVGLVPPQYYGKSGSVSYELPAGSATPSEVLITLEPRQNRPTRPTGPVVLRGP